MKALEERRFTKLVRELTGILDRAATSSKTSKVHGYWHLGERIARERIADDVGYHNAVLRDVARAVGVTARTLQRSVAFHEAYAQPPKDPLGWSHYMELSSLRKKGERSFYQKRALGEGWSVRDLRAAIDADLYRGGVPQEPELQRPTGAGFVYRAKNARIVDGDTVDLQLDLGFSCWTERRIRLAAIDCPEPKTPAGRAARAFVAHHLGRARTLVVRSVHSGTHGRYLGHVFFSTAELSIDDCYQEGLYLNDLLVQEGHATVVG